MGTVKDQHRAKVELVQQTVALKLTMRATEVHEYLRDAGHDIGLSTVQKILKECRDANWRWLSDTAKHTYIADLRDRAIDIKEAMKHTMQELANPGLKPHARAQLNNSLVMLSKEMTELIEGQGVLRHWDALINKKDPEWQKAAMAQDTSDTDADLT